MRCCNHFSFMTANNRNISNCCNNQANNKSIYLCREYAVDAR